MNNTWAFGGLVRTLRLLSSLSVAEASHRAGINPAHLNRVESGKRGVSATLLDALGQIYGGFSRLPSDHVARWLMETHQVLEHPDAPRQGPWGTAVEETLQDARALHRIVGTTPNGLRELLQFAELYWSDVNNTYALAPYEGGEWIAYCLMMLLRDPLEFGNGDDDYPAGDVAAFPEVRRWYQGIRDHLRKDMEWDEAMATGNPHRTVRGEIMHPQPADVTSLLQQAYSELYRLDEREVTIQKIMKLLPTLGRQELNALYVLLWRIKS